MNKTFLFASSVGVALSCGVVNAQSTVTLYGLIDTGLMYVHNSGGQSTQIAMVTGSQSGSRWGVKGSEDLGAGLKALFQLENGFISTNGKLGQGSRMFGRQAFVGLSSDRFGTLTAGRQYDPLIDLVQPVQSDNYLGGFFSTPGDVDNADNSVRVNNAVKWTSPKWGGLTAETMYSFGGVAGSVGSGQTFSVALSYNTGALALAGGFLHVDNGNAVTSSRSTTSSDSFFNSSVNNAYASANSIDVARAGGNYTIESFILGGYYSFARYNADASSTFSKSEKYHTGSVYAVWQASPALQTQIGYTYTKSLGDSSAKYNQVSIAADYFASKRTDLYTVASYGHASGQNGAGKAQAVIGSIDIDAGKSSQALLTVGLRHKF